MKMLWIAALLFAIVLIGTGPAKAGHYDRVRSVRLQADVNRVRSVRPQADVPPGNAETGRKLWASYGCWQCHGYEAQGGAAGPRLASRPLSFARFSTYVRRPTNQMPPYTAKTVPDSDLAHLYAYLQARPAPPPIASIPLLQK